MKWLKHLNTVNKHRFLVLCHSIKLGIPLLGLKHDLSKYSFEEFFRSSKYYNGKYSPLVNERIANDNYSLVYNHHIGRNKHHFDYWCNYYRNHIVVREIPFKYCLEYLADTIAASKVYLKKDFQRKAVLDFWNAKNKYFIMHTKTKEFIEMIIKEYSDNGFKNLKKRKLKEKYNILHQDIHSEYYRIDMQRRESL